MKKEISDKEVLKKIKKKEKIDNYKIKGTVNLFELVKPSKLELKKEVIFENCERYCQ